MLITWVWCSGSYSIVAKSAGMLFCVVTSSCGNNFPYLFLAHGGQNIFNCAKRWDAHLIRVTHTVWSKVLSKQSCHACICSFINVIAVITLNGILNLEAKRSPLPAVDSPVFCQWVSPSFLQIRGHLINFRCIQLHKFIVCAEEMLPQLLPQFLYRTLVPSAQFSGRCQHNNPILSFLQDFEWI